MFYLKYKLTPDHIESNKNTYTFKGGKGPKSPLRIFICSFLANPLRILLGLKKFNSTTFIIPIIYQFDQLNNQIENNNHFKMIIY